MAYKQGDHIKKVPSDISCAHCRSFDVKHHGYTKLSSGKKIRLFQCLSSECGKFFQEEYVFKQIVKNQSCPFCNYSDVLLSGFGFLMNGDQVQLYKCRRPECERHFPSTESGLNFQVKDFRKCPSCNGIELTIKEASFRKDGTPFTRFLCKNKDCRKTFIDNYKSSYIDGISCPFCSCDLIKKAPRYIKKDKTIVKRYLCCNPDCGKTFPEKYSVLPAQAAGQNCPYCQSSNTVKEGKPRKRKDKTEAQSCLCKDCDRHFTLGGRQNVTFYLNGKVLYKCWWPPGPKFDPSVSCPVCKEQKAALKTESNKGTDKSRKIYICFSCGQHFGSEVWKTQIYSRNGMDVPRKPWRFEDDLWDLRELYPDIENKNPPQIFLNFSKSGSFWFVKILKRYIKNRINSGIGFRRILSGDLCYLSAFGRFLKTRKINTLNNLNRADMNLFWVHECGSYKDETLHQAMGIVESFLVWGNANELFETSPTLITTFDRPKIFRADPDPLEDHVLNSIRDNLYKLPKPFQLMFMLCFWAGMRPGEVCNLSKDCIELDLDGSMWWLKFYRSKGKDLLKLPISTDLVHVIQEQQKYITSLFGKDYEYLFCHYQGVIQQEYPSYISLKPVIRPPIVTASMNPMVKAIRHLIKNCNIQDSNGKLAKFTGEVLRPSRATQLIQEGFSLDFVRIWLGHRDSTTTKRHYTRYRPGELLDVACVMANFDSKFIQYEKNIDSLKREPKQHELDGLQTLGGEPLYGYCIYRDFCPKFGRCYSCGFHVASEDKLPLYRSQLKRLEIKNQEALKSGSAEILEGYKQIKNSLEKIVQTLEES